MLGLPMPRPRVLAFGPAHMVIVVALLLLGLFAYAAVQTAAQSHRLREEERQLVAEINELQTRNAELRGLSDYIQSDEYIEAFAREQFGLVMPGETVVEVKTPPKAEATRAAGEEWWERLFTR